MGGFIIFSSFLFYSTHFNDHLLLTDSKWTFCTSSSLYSWWPHQRTYESIDQRYIIHQTQHASKNATDKKNARTLYDTAIRGVYIKGEVRGCSWSQCRWYEMKQKSETITTFDEIKKKEADVLGSFSSFFPTNSHIANFHLLTNATIVESLGHFQVVIKFFPSTSGFLNM